MKPVLQLSIGFCPDPKPPYTRVEIKPFTNVDQVVIKTVHCPAGWLKDAADLPVLSASLKAEIESHHPGLQCRWQQLQQYYGTNDYSCTCIYADGLSLTICSLDASDRPMVQSPAKHVMQITLDTPRPKKRAAKHGLEKSLAL